MATENELVVTKRLSLFSRKHLNIVKGLGIFLIVAELLCVQYLKFPFSIGLHDLGVAMFLFCTGYKASDRFIRHDNLSHYWEDILVGTWFPSLVALCLIFGIIGSGPLDWISVYPLALYGNYLQILMVEYLVFWVMSTYISDPKSRLFWMFMVSTLAFILMTDVRYAPLVFAFPIGAACANNELKTVIRELNVTKRVLICLGLIVLATGFALLKLLPMHYLLTNLLTMGFLLCGMALIVLAVYFLRKIHVFTVFYPLGIVSYQMYLVHETVLKFLSSRNDIKAMAVVLAILVAISAAFWFACDLMARGNDRMRSRKKRNIWGIIEK